MARLLVLALLFAPALSHAELQRKTLSRQDGGRVKAQTRSLRADKAKSPGSAWSELIQGAAEGIFDVIVNEGADDGDAGDEIEFRTGDGGRYRLIEDASGSGRLQLSAFDDEPLEPETTFEYVDLRFVRTRLWTGIETSFESPGFANLQWEKRAFLGGVGAEANMGYRTDGGMLMNFGLGCAYGTKVTNFHSEGATYVKETSETRLYTANVMMRRDLGDWWYLTVGLALFIADLDTRVATNAASFSYDGVTGTSVWGAAGGGLGFETAWRFPLRLFAGARFWIPTAEDPVYRSVVGDVNMGARWRFGQK